MTAGRSIVSVFCLLLTPYCLLLFPSCKNSIIPPDKLPPVETGPDTTSHNFTWQIDTLGDGNASILEDVFIIDENNIWAVGEIYLKDSAGQWIYPAYNVARWNGTSWTLDKITVQFQGSQITLPLEGVFAFSPTDIWVVGSLPIHGNGQTWTLYDVRATVDPNLSLSKTWGSASSNMYFVGRGGSIAHFNGSSWQKLESGTTLYFADIWGGMSGDSLEILAVASLGISHAIMKISGSTVETISDSGIQGSLAGVWLQPGRKYFTVGNGIYRKNRLSDSIWTGAPLELTPYGSGAVRGTDTSNVFVVGAFGDFLHYNGSTWKQYPELLMSNGSYYTVSCSGKTVAAVGHVGNRAIALIGRRQ